MREGICKSGEGIIMEQANISVSKDYHSVLLRKKSELESRLGRSISWQDYLRMYHNHLSDKHLNDKIKVKSSQ